MYLIGLTHIIYSKHVKHPMGVTGLYWGLYNGHSQDRFGSKKTKTGGSYPALVHTETLSQVHIHTYPCLLNESCYFWFYWDIQRTYQHPKVTRINPPTPTSHDLLILPIGNKHGQYKFCVENIIDALKNTHWSPRNVQVQSQ